MIIVLYNIIIKIEYDNNNFKKNEKKKFNLLVMWCKINKLYLVCFKTLILNQSLYFKSNPNPVLMF